MISAMASSTTLRVLENGALKTAVPCSVAVVRSIWLVPMQNAPIASRSGAASSTAWVTLVFERMPSSCTPGSAADQLGLVQGTLDGLDLDPALGQQPDAFGMDVLEQ